MNQYKVRQAVEDYQALLKFGTDQYFKWYAEQLTFAYNLTVIANRYINGLQK